jgi:hypothetical protein
VSEAFVPRSDDRNATQRLTTRARRFWPELWIKIDRLIKLVSTDGWIERQPRRGQPPP